MSTSACTIRTIAALAVAVTALTAPAPVGASPDRDIQAQIDAQLALDPTGVQISPDQVSYHNGTMTITFRSRTRSQSQAAVAPQTLTPDCPSGSFCLYESVNYEGRRISYTTCTFRDLYPYYHDWADSIAFNKPSGYVNFINHGKANHVGDTVLYTLSPARRAVFDVKPYRNAIDHVDGAC